MLLSHDPGGAGGWALWDVHTRELQAAFACAPWGVHSILQLYPHPFISAIAYEHPVHNKGNEKANPNTLITLGLRCGIALGQLRPWFLPGFDQAQHIKGYTPVSWKGGVPKRIHQPRILRKLSAVEHSRCAGASADTVDAIGIGLHHLGRHHPGR